MMVLSARDQLLETALRLFHRDGFHATGIDRILAEANVSKMTLYKYFPSKTELILAVLRLRDERFRALLVDGVAKRSPNHYEQLLAMFDVLEDWFASPDYHGCLFINATAEYGRADDPIHAAAAEHKQALLTWVIGLAKAAQIVRPEEAARRLLMLKEGAIVTAQVSGAGIGEQSVARQARRLAALVLAEHRSVAA